MSKNLYVGNLAFAATEDDLRQAFGQYGTVTEAKIITDRDTGRSRGFGFVEMDDGSDAAIDALNGTELAGRRLTVNEARPRTERRGGGFDVAGKYLRSATKQPATTYWCNATMGLRPARALR